VFTTGNNEKLATVDVYKQTTDKVNNTVADLGKTISVGTDKLAVLTSVNKKGLSNKFFNIDKSGNVKLDSSTLLSGVLGDNPSIKSAMGNLDDAKALGSKTLSGYQNVIRQYGGVVTKLGNGSFKNAAGLISIVHVVAGINIPSNLTDKSALTNIMTAVIGQGAAIGLYGLLDPFIKSDVGKVLAFGVISKLAPIIVKKAYTALMAEIAGAGHGPTLLKTKPDFIYDFVSKYKVPKNFKAEDLLKEWDAIESSLNAIDPQWLFETVNGQQYVNAELIYRASTQFKEVLRLKVMSLDILHPTPAALDAITSTRGEVVASNKD